MEYISSRFENEPNEIWNHLSEKGSKGRFFTPGKFANPTNEGRERGGRKEDHFTFLGNCPPTPPLSRKGGEEKLPTYPSPKPEKRRREKSNGCTLNFYNGYFEFVAEKKLFDGGGPFSSDVFKIRLDINKHF